MFQQLFTFFKMCCSIATISKKITIKPNFITLAMLTTVMLSVTMLNAVMLSVNMQFC
jgi:hypothetical protein